MSLESSLTPNLQTLTDILEAYSRASGNPAKAHALITSGELGDLALTHPDGAYITDPALVQDFMVAVNELIAAKVLPADCDIRLETMEVEPTSEEHATGDAAPENTEPFIQEPGNPGDLSAVPYAHNDGMTLRKALLSHGHSTGYRVRDIDDAVTRLDGKTLPEIRFFRSTVREGKVAEGPHGDIFSSDIAADFGRELFADAAVRLPAPTPNDVVQPKLAHKYWVELAHDAQTLYAADLAPGASGAIGQIIARSAMTAEPPYIVARSLSQFVTGDWIQGATERVAQNQSAEEESGPRWESVSSVLEPSAEAAPVLENASAPEVFDQESPAHHDHGLVQEVEQATDESLEQETANGTEQIGATATENRGDENPADENEGFTPDQPAASLHEEHSEESYYRSQINTLLGRQDEEKSPIFSHIDAELDGQKDPSADATQPEGIDPFAPVEPEARQETSQQPQRDAAPTTENEPENNFMKGLRRFFLG